MYNKIMFVHIQPVIVRYKNMYVHIPHEGGVFCCILGLEGGVEGGVGDRILFLLKLPDDKELSPDSLSSSEQSFTLS